MANKLQLAEAQILGFQHGKRGYNLSDLVHSMGLTKSEWEKLKSSGMVNYLPDYMMEEIEVTINPSKK